MASKHKSKSMRPGDMPAQDAPTPGSFEASQAEYRRQDAGYSARARARAAGVLGPLREEKEEPYRPRSTYRRPSGPDPMELFIRRLLGGEGSGGSTGSTSLDDADDLGQELAEGMISMEDYYGELGLPPKLPGQKLIQSMEDGEIHSRYVWDTSIKEEASRAVMGFAPKVGLALESGGSPDVSSRLYDALSYAEDDEIKEIDLGDGKYRIEVDNPDPLKRAQFIYDLNDDILEEEYTDDMLYAMGQRGGQ